jgi:surface antigen
MHSGRLFAVAVIGAGLAGCAGNPYPGSYAGPPGAYGPPPPGPYASYPGPGPREGAGTILGSVAGAAIGSQIGGGTGERIAAGIAGAAIGGLIGNRIGAAMDDEDKQRAYQAQLDALNSGPPGAPVAWENPDSGRHGSIVPGPAYDRRGVKCRDYTHTIYIDGRPQVARGAACRNPDGTWSPA